MRLLLQVFLFLSLSMSVRAEEARLPRHPAPSPDGRLVAFSWQGDIWTVPSGGGPARRITVHPACDRHPVWSRDGSLLAFASSRHGNNDVFVMPADGSTPPRRLTFASSNDRPLDFGPEGESVLFSSSRDLSQRWMHGLYEVPLTGGTPTLAQSALARDAAYSPDGGRLLFVRGAIPWSRSGYRGSANLDLWLREEDGAYRRLTDFAGDDAAPSWIDETSVCFLSGRVGRKNIQRLDLGSGQVRAITEHGGSDARFPSCSSDGLLIAYEFEDAIWTVGSEAGSEPRRLRIEVPADAIALPLRARVASSDATGLAVSPDGKLAAYIIHGDIFLTGISSKEEQELSAPPTRRLSATPQREGDLRWAPDGEALLFSSDRAGNWDLFLLEPGDEELGWLDSHAYSVEALRDGPEQERDGLFSPDGKHIAYLRDKGDLLICDADGGNPRVIFTHWQRPDFCWSPDGRWLCYSRPDIDYNQDIWLVSADGGEPYNVSRHPDDDHSPFWSADGKRLLWISRRHADSNDVWGVWLRREDDERGPAQWLAHWQAEKDRPDPEPENNADGEETGEDKEAETPEVLIDFDGLWERVRAISSLRGDELAPSAAPDCKQVFFSADFEGERDLYSLRWDGEERKRLTTGGQNPDWLSWSADGKTIFYLDRQGRMKRIAPDGGKELDPMPFEARYEYSLREERAEVFAEAWRELSLWFYDPTFHGVDWPAQAEKYRPWALAASTPEDFEDVMDLMLGELNASHVNYSLPGGKSGELTGWLGAIYDPAADGPGLLIERVIPDSPADRVDVDLAAGDRILAVDGRELAAGVNIHDLLRGSRGRVTRLLVRKANGDEQRLRIEAISQRALQRLAYGEWVRERRAIVAELSGERLGYLHIPTMSMPRFEEFERDLYVAGHGREGLLIDVRSNNGGWITDYLFAVLGIRRHAYTVPRDAPDGERGYPQGRLPLSAWTKPALLLCNEESFSNAEIFAHAFKELERGVVFGMPTYGAVISTGGTGLLDGSWLRLPGRGWYTAGAETVMENNGCRPDIIVEQPPEEDLSSEHDTQLNRAVAELLSRLADDPRAANW